MSNPTIRPEGAAWVTPYICVSQIEPMLAFYKAAFNFETLHSAPDDSGILSHAELRYKDQMLMVGRAGAYGGTSLPPNISGTESPMNLYLYCDNVDQFYNNAIKVGAQSLGEPEDMFWGDRMCRLKDPDGYVWCFATHKG